MCKDVGTCDASGTTVTLPSVEAVTGVPTPAGNTIPTGYAWEGAGASPDIIASKTEEDKGEDRDEDVEEEGIRGGEFDVEEKSGAKNGGSGRSKNEVSGEFPLRRRLRRRAIFAG